MITQYKENIKEVKYQITGIELYKGDEAFRLLADEAFLQSWDILYKSCNWATVFQHKAFVITWYKTYQTKILPVILLSRSGSKLNGLITLAMPISDADKSVIMGAGEYEAEYQAWLASSDDNDHFIKSALQKLMAVFPKSNIHLRFLPSKTPLNWINHAEWKNKCVLQQHRQPIMDLQHPDLSRKFRKTEFRNKINRLKRLGNVEFISIVNKEDFLNVLDEILIQFDFRQAGMFNLNQFMDEPLKKEFLIALFEKNLLHVSVLKVNDQLFASIIAVVMGDWVHLGGINVHTPFNAKFYSPGFIHFILLAEHLSRTDYAYFDLTPGGDFYKERMATQHDVVHELVITNNAVYNTKRKIRRWYYRELEKRGKWPMGVELTVRKNIYLFKNKIQKIKNEGMIKSLQKAFEALSSVKQNQVMMYQMNGLKNDTQLKLHKNNLFDLLKFEAIGTWKTKWEFFEDAMRRFEMGESCYTYCENGSLLYCVWLKPDQKHTTKTMDDTNLQKENLQKLDGFYCHPKGQKEWKSFLSSAIVTTLAAGKEESILADINKRDRFLKASLQSIGFEHVGTK